jgi:hypothetical protein
MLLNERAPTCSSCCDRHRDSFIVCIQAALEHWGRLAPFDCVAALSGAAFSPMVSTSTRCPAWWTCTASDVRIEFMGHTLGFTVETAGEETLRDPALRDEFVRRARCALRHGAVILGGSKPRWRIVTGNDPDALELLVLLRVAPNADVSTDTRVHILRPADRTLTRCEAIRESLRFGARAASGTAWRNGGPASGAGFYDAWLTALDKGSLCPKCRGLSWRCAGETTHDIHSMQISAARFLGRAGAQLPHVCSRRRVEQIAEAYSQMAATLAPFCADKGPSPLWEDPTARDGYVAGVRRVRELQHAAAQGLARLTTRL